MKQIVKKTKRNTYTYVVRQQTHTDKINIKNINL